MRCGYPLRVDRYPADHLLWRLCDLARVPAMGWPLPGRYPLATLAPSPGTLCPLTGYPQAGQASYSRGSGLSDRVPKVCVSVSSADTRPRPASVVARVLGCVHWTRERFGHGIGHGFWAQVSPGKQRRPSGAPSDAWMEDCADWCERIEALQRLEPAAAAMLPHGGRIYARPASIQGIRGCLTASASAPQEIPSLRGKLLADTKGSVFPCQNP